MKRLALAAIIAAALVPSARPIDASMKNCVRLSYGDTMEQRCEYTQFPNPATVWQRVVVKCDGMWPISDFTAAGNWARGGQRSIVSCGEWRTPRYQSTEVAT